MFHIENLCEGVYDLWWQNSEEDYAWEFVDTFDTYDEAENDMYCRTLIMEADNV